MTSEIDRLVKLVLWYLFVKLNSDESSTPWISSIETLENRCISC
jgi:hypothetical protein